MCEWTKKKKTSGINEIISLLATSFKLQTRQFFMHRSRVGVQYSLNRAKQKKNHSRNCENTFCDSRRIESEVTQDTGLQYPSLSPTGVNGDNARHTDSVQILCKYRAYLVLKCKQIDHRCYQSFIVSDLVMCSL